MCRAAFMQCADFAAACAAAINFSTPTRIQQSVIPVLLAGRDVLASAPTGSGKTLSYIAPVVHQIQVLVRILGSRVLEAMLTGLMRLCPCASQPRDCNCRLSDIKGSPLHCKCSSRPSTHCCCHRLPCCGEVQALLPRVSRQSGTHAVIMAPTRELCIQIYDVLALILRRYHWVVCA